MFAERKSVTLTTDAAGAATGYIDVPHGRVMSIAYIKDGSVPFADTVDFTATVESTGAPIWSQSNVTASQVRYPRAAVHDVLGAAALYADAGEAIVEPIMMANDRIKIVIAEGGDTKQGVVSVIIG